MTMAYTLITQWSSRYIRVNCPHDCEQPEHEFGNPGIRKSRLKSDLEKYTCDFSGRDIIPIFPYEDIIDNSGLFWVKDHNEAVWMTVGNTRGDLANARYLSALGVPRTPRPRPIPLGFVSDTEDEDLDDSRSDESDANDVDTVGENQYLDASNSDYVAHQMDDLSSRLAGVAIRPKNPKHDAMIRACVNNDWDRVQSILHEVADPTQLLLDARGYQGITALHLAAGSGYRDMVDLLSTYKKLLAAKCDEGWTPLQFAFYAQQYRIVIMLLEAGASFDVLDEDCCNFTQLCKEELCGSWTLLKYINDNYSAKTAYLKDIGKKLFDNIPLLKRTINIIESINNPILSAESIYLSPNANDNNELDIIAQLHAISLGRQWISNNVRSRTAACLTRGHYLPPISATSGWSDVEEDNIIAGRPWRDETFELAKLVGHHLPRHPYDEKNRPGSYFASHAEKKALTAFIATHTLTLERPDFFRGIAKFVELNRCEPPLCIGFDIRIYIRQDNGIGSIPEYCSDCIQFMQQVVDWFGFRLQLHLLRNDGKQLSAEFLKLLVPQFV